MIRPLRRQDLVHGGDHRHRHAVALQATRDLAGAPHRMRVAHRQHLRLDRRIAAPRTAVRPPRPIGQFHIAGLLPPQPLIANVRADPEPPAQLPTVDTLLHRKADKLTPLVHYRHLSPWHGKPPEKGHSSQYGCVSYVSEHLSVICPV